MKGLIASVVIILVIIAVPLSSRYYMNNIFRADKVSLVTLGMTEDEVEEVFGSPYRGQTDDMASADLVWKYYDADYMKLLEKNDSFDPGGIGDEDDFESAFEDSVAHQSNIIRIVYSSRVSGSDLLFILKICNKKRELADFTPQALVPFLSVSNGKPFRFRPQWRYPCVNQWDHSYLIFY